MTTKEFNKSVKSIFKKYEMTTIEDSDKAQISTVFGDLTMRAEWIPSIKVASLHTRLKGDVKLFKEKMFKNISSTGKCNFYSSNPEFILNELEEYLNNLKWLNENK